MFVRSIINTIQLVYTINNINSKVNCVHYAHKTPLDIRQAFDSSITIVEKLPSCEINYYTLFMSSKHSNFSINSTIQLINATEYFAIFYGVHNSFQIQNSKINIIIKNSSNINILGLQSYHIQNDFKLLNTVVTYQAINSSVTIIIGISQQTNNLTLLDCTIQSNISTLQDFFGLSKQVKQSQIVKLNLNISTSTPVFAGLFKIVSDSLILTNSIVNEQITGGELYGLVKSLMKGNASFSNSQCNINLTGTNDVNILVYETINNAVDDNFIYVENFTITTQLYSEKVPSLISKLSTIKTTLNSLKILNPSQITSKSDNFGSLVYSTNSTLNIQDIEADFYVYSQDISKKIGYVMYESLAGNSINYNFSSTSASKQLRVRGTFFDCPCIQGACLTNVNLLNSCQWQSISIQNDTINKLTPLHPPTNILINANQSQTYIQYISSQYQLNNDSNMNNTLIDFNSIDKCQNCSLTAFYNGIKIFYKINVTGTFQASADDVNSFPIIAGLIGIVAEDSKFFMCVTKATLITGANTYAGGLIGVINSGNVLIWQCIVDNIFQSSSLSDKKVCGGLVAIISGGEASLKDCVVISKFDNFGDTYGGYIGIVKSGASLSINNCSVKGNLTMYQSENPFIMSTSGGVIGIIEIGATVTTYNVFSNITGFYTNCSCFNSTGSQCAGITCATRPTIIIKNGTFTIAMTISNSYYGTMSSKFAIGTQDVNNTIFQYNESVTVTDYGGTIIPKPIYFNVEVTSTTQIQTIQNTWKYFGVLTLQTTYPQTNVIRCQYTANIVSITFSMVGFLSAMTQTTNVINCSFSGLLNAQETGIVARAADDGSIVTVQNIYVDAAIQSVNASGIVTFVRGLAFVSFNNITANGDFTCTACNFVGAFGQLFANSRVSITQLFMTGNTVTGKANTAAVVAVVEMNVQVSIQDCILKVKVVATTPYAGAVFGMIATGATVIASNVTYYAQPGNANASCPVNVNSPVQITSGIICN